MILQAGRIVLPQRELVGGWLKVEGGKITDLGEGTPPGEAVDLGELTLIPGLVEVHIHGARGADTMDATPQALETMAQMVATGGVTSFLPTTMSAPAEAVVRAVENVGKHMGQSFVHGARILGVHIEGPFIAKEFKGAQLESTIRPGTKEEVDRLYQLLPQGGLKLVTVAPELQQGIVVPLSLRWRRQWPRVSLRLPIQAMACAPSTIGSLEYWVLL